jgi:hypothetical protein
MDSLSDDLIQAMRAALDAKNVKAPPNPIETKLYDWRAEMILNYPSDAAVISEGYNLLRTLLL